MKFSARVQAADDGNRAGLTFGDRHPKSIAITLAAGMRATAERATRFADLDKDPIAVRTLGRPVSTHTGFADERISAP